MSSKYDELERKEQEFEESILISDLKNGYKKELQVIKVAYKRLIEIVTQFLKQFPEVNDKSNNEYIELFGVVEKNINLIKKDIEERMDNQTLPSFYISSKFLEDIIYKPFDNLYTAETDLSIVNPNLQNDEFRLLRKKMNKSLGDIEAMIAGVKINTYSKLIGGDYSGFLPKDYKWSDNGRDFLIDNNRLPFGSKKSIRKTVFEMLVEKDGGYVYTRVLANAIGRDKNYVKSVVSQLNKKLWVHGLKSFLVIKAMGDHKQPSAYRLIPTPEGKH